MEKLRNKECLDKTIEHICNDFELSYIDLISRRRVKELSIARWLIFNLLKTNSILSLVEIGDKYDKDHTSVIHGIREIHIREPELVSKYQSVYEDYKR
tara:strand:+ start:1581 stop:1874 length:294 start_codon:yes stop_codon:yes gene_type:complete